MMKYIFLLFVLLQIVSSEIVITQVGNASFSETLPLVHVKSIVYSSDDLWTSSVSGEFIILSEMVVEDFCVDGVFYPELQDKIIYHIRLPRPYGLNVCKIHKFLEIASTKYNIKAVIVHDDLGFWDVGGVEIGWMESDTYISKILAATARFPEDVLARLPTFNANGTSVNKTFIGEIKSVETNPYQKIQDTTAIFYIVVIALLNILNGAVASKILYDIVKSSGFHFSLLPCVALPLEIIQAIVHFIEVVMSFYAAIPTRSPFAFYFIDLIFNTFFMMPLITMLLSVLFYRAIIQSVNNLDSKAAGNTWQKIKIPFLIGSAVFYFGFALITIVSYSGSLGQADVGYILMMTFSAVSIAVTILFTGFLLQFYQILKKSESDKSQSYKLSKKLFGAGALNIFFNVLGIFLALSVTFYIDDSVDWWYAWRFLMSFSLWGVSFSNIIVYGFFLGHSKGQSGKSTEMTGGKSRNSSTSGVSSTSSKNTSASEDA